jgi:hypothetical protein
MDINQFRNKLGAGGARPNQFLVTLNFPAGVGVAGDKSILVVGASIPASNVNPTIVQYRGRAVKLAGERDFDPWTVTIINDTDMSLRRLFERWSDLMNNRINNSGSTQPSTYYADLLVSQLDRNDETIRTYQIYNAFPNSVSEITLAYGQNDVISEFNVTFQYSHFEVLPL